MRVFTSGTQLLRIGMRPPPSLRPRGGHNSVVLLFTSRGRGRAREPPLNPTPPPTQFKRGNLGASAALNLKRNVKLGEIASERCWGGKKFESYRVAAELEQARAFP